MRSALTSSNSWAFSIATAACAEKARLRCHDLMAYHEQQMREIDDRIAIRRLFEPYARTLTINLELYSGGS